MIIAIDLAHHRGRRRFRPASRGFPAGSSALSCCCLTGATGAWHLRRLQCLFSHKLSATAAAPRPLPRVPIGKGNDVRIESAAHLCRIQQNYQHGQNRDDLFQHGNRHGAVMRKAVIKVDTARWRIQGKSASTPAIQDGKPLHAHNVQITSPPSSSTEILGSAAILLTV